MKETTLAPRLAGVDCTKGEETAILVESELRLGTHIAAVKIAGERVVAFARPFDGAPDPSRRPGNEREFRTGCCCGCRNCRRQRRARDRRMRDAAGDSRSGEVASVCTSLICSYSFHAEIFFEISGNIGD
jgi:hypothetical protein